MSDKTSYTYDPKTGNWVPTTVSGGSDTTTPSDSTKPTPSDSATGSVNNVSSNTNSSEKAEKEYIETEFNVLTGNLTVTPTEKSIRIKINDTIKIEGIGKYLSGLYFVSAITRNLSKDGGYTHSFTLIKNGFGDSIKQAQVTEDTNTGTDIPTEETRPEEVQKEPTEFKVGDSVKIVGDDAVYSNAHDGVKVPNWVKKKTLTVQQVSSDGTRVLLMPIYSWTYIKYVQKV